MGGAFQIGELKPPAKATSEKETPLSSNKTATETSHAPPKPAEPNAQQQQTLQGSASTQAQKPAAQETVKPSSQHLQQDLTNHDPVDTSQKATSTEAKTDQPAIHAVQLGKEAAALQVSKQPAEGKPKVSAPAQHPVSSAQPLPAAPARPAQSATAPPQPRPTTAAMHAPSRQHPQQNTVVQNKQPTHAPPSRMPTTVKVNKMNPQLATLTRSENIHHLFQPTMALQKPTKPALVRNQQAAVQHFPTRGKYRDEE